MNETDTRVELRKASDALLDAGHADQDHAHVAAVEDGPHLFETVHLQSVGLIDDDEVSRIGNLLLASLIVLVGLKIDRVYSRPITGGAPWSIEDLAPPYLIAKPDRFEYSASSRSIGRTAMPANFSRALPKSEAILEGVLTTSAVYMTVSNIMEGIVASFHRS
jgi:hypothetical protein